MRLQNDEIAMSKEEFLTNILFAGIACQLIADNSSRDLNYWMQHLSDMAEEQHEKMSSKQREEMINAYIQISQNI